jgi:hypothetical protein
MNWENRINAAASEPVIRPLAVSALAKELLGDAVPIVRAIHRSGISLSIPDQADICYLGLPGSGLLPLHVVVNRSSFRQLMERLSGCASTGQHVRLDFAGVRVFHLSLAPANLQARQPRIAVDRVATWLRLRTEPCGLGEPAADALSVDGRIRHALAAVEANPSNAQHALRALIGRGTGSTPAGDDMLVGALAHAHACGAGNAPLVGAMRELMPEFDRLTTAAGATYLRAAVRGHFGGDLLSFMNALARAPAERALHRAMRVANHGATSGIDTLLGFVAADEAAR